MLKHAFGFMTFLLCSFSYSAEFSFLAELNNSRTAAENSLWVETPPIRRFDTTTHVVCADIKGPAEITMIHFAYPQSNIATTRTLGRELLLRIYWDDEKEPSVDCPMVDFFCDPAGRREIVNNAMVNKLRGFNAYFPMPFRKSGRVELVYDGPLAASQELWSDMPCYGYVMYRTRNDLTENTAYFHTNWRREVLKLGERDYLAMEATGRGKFVGWNVTVRRPGSGGYPVDMNEKFTIDGETSPSIELQGIEDSFGYSWGFPAKEAMFQYTGWFPFFQGAAAYRLFLSDAINFERSLRVTIGFGDGELGFKKEFASYGSSLELGSTCYWYQTEPHKSFGPMPGNAERSPAPELFFYPEQEVLPSAAELQTSGIKLLMLCGRPGKEVVHAAPGFDAKVIEGFSYAGFPGPEYYCRASEKEVKIEIQVPPQADGKLRIFIQDPDNFQGGRKQEVYVFDKKTGEFTNFQHGKWIETTLGNPNDTAGTVPVRVVNLNPKSNAVVSRIEWVDRSN